MDFTFWERKSVQLPRGQLYGVFGFLVGLAVLCLLGEWAGSLVTKKEIKFNGPTLKDLQAIQQIVSTGDLAKIDTMLQKDGPRIGADMSKWTLVAKWHDDALFQLYKGDLAASLDTQIAALQKAVETEKAKAAPAGGAAGGGAAAPAAAPAKP